MIAAPGIANLSATTFNPKLRDLGVYRVKGPPGTLVLSGTSETKALLLRQFSAACLWKEKHILLAARRRGCRRTRNFP